MKKIIGRVESVNELKSCFEELPVVIVPANSDEETFNAVANMFGGPIDNPMFGKIRELVVNNNTQNFSVGSSDSAHPPHTDGVYNQDIIPAFMLQCVQPDLNGGGKGLFWNTLSIFDDMPSKFRDFLSEDQFFYSRLREDGITYDMYEGAIFFENQGKMSFRWRYDLQVRPRLMGEASNEKNKLFHDSVTWILSYLLQNPPEIYEYKKGDIIICDNLHILHGRTKILSSERFFRRAWLNYNQTK